MWCSRIASRAFDYSVMSNMLFLERECSSFGGFVWYELREESCNRPAQAFRCLID